MVNGNDLKPTKVSSPRIKNPNAGSPDAQSMLDKLFENLGLGKNGGGGA